VQAQPQPRTACGNEEFVSRQCPHYCTRSDEAGFVVRAPFTVVAFWHASTATRQHCCASTNMHVQQASTATVETELGVQHLIDDEYVVAGCYQGRTGLVVQQSRMTNQTWAVEPWAYQAPNRPPHRSLPTTYHMHRSERSQVPTWWLPFEEVCVKAVSSNQNSWPFVNLTTQYKKNVPRAKARGVVTTGGECSHITCRWKGCRHAQHSSPTINGLAANSGHVGHVLEHPNGGAGKGGAAPLRRFNPRQPMAVPYL
jgi:hypothetical protein